MRSDFAGIAGIYAYCLAKDFEAILDQFSDECGWDGDDGGLRGDLYHLIASVE